jgi:hypothetical protein
MTRRIGGFYSVVDVYDIGLVTRQNVKNNYKDQPFNSREVLTYHVQLL